MRVQFRPYADILRVPTIATEQEKSSGKDAQKSDLPEKTALRELQPGGKQRNAEGREGCQQKHKAQSSFAAV